MCKIKPTDFEWFGHIEGFRPNRIGTDTYLSLARFVHKHYQYDIVPQVTEYVILPEPNTYGDDVLATVQYNATGAVTSLGGHLDDNGRIEWTCYAD